MFGGVTGLHSGAMLSIDPEQMHVLVHPRMGDQITGRGRENEINGRAQRHLAVAIHYGHVCTCCVMLCYVMLCYMGICHVMSCHVMSCHIMSYKQRIVSRHKWARCVMLYKQRGGIGTSRR